MSSDGFRQSVKQFVQWAAALVPYCDILGP